METQTKSSKKRNTLIDAIKGVAVVLMLIFHYFYLANEMGVERYSVGKGILKAIAKIAHITFIVMVGINLKRSYNKWKNMGKTSIFYKNQIKRSITLLAGAILISFFSKKTFGESYVKWGILHFLGTHILLTQFFTDSSSSTLIQTAALIEFLNLFAQVNRNLFFGICKENPMTCFISGILNLKYNALDHFNLLGFMGKIFLGMYLGNTVNWDTLNIKNVGLVKILSWLGSKSLLIYLIHIPLLYFYLNK
jgi:uncharacterized membrane protein